MVRPGFPVLLKTAGAHLLSSGTIAGNSIFQQPCPPCSAQAAHDNRSWPQTPAAHMPSPTEWELATGVLQRGRDKPPLHTGWLSQTQKSSHTQCDSMALMLKEVKGETGREAPVEGRAAREGAVQESQDPEPSASWLVH